MCRQHFTDSSTDVHSDLLCGRSVFPVSPPLSPSGFCPQTMEHLKSQKGRKWQGRVTSPSTAAHQMPTAACSVCVCVCFPALMDCAVRSWPRCNDIQIGRVICQVHFAWGSTPGRSVHCVGRGRESITRRLYLQSNFIPPARVED